MVATAVARKRATSSIFMRFLICGFLEVTQGRILNHSQLARRKTPREFRDYVAGIMMAYQQERGVPAVLISYGVVDAESDDCDIRMVE